MRYIILALVGMGLFINIPTGEARPVSYPGGITFMTMNDGAKNSAHLHYSPTAKYSVGLKQEYWRYDETLITAVQINNLVKRWNKRDSQANLYLKSGVGIATNDGESEAVGYTGFATDWENRRFFMSYENRFTEFAKLDDFFMQSARIGWAPYEGDYGDLHTWLMLQVEHEPQSIDHFTITPLVRFFKGVHLLEAGMSTRGEVLFNYVYRY